MAELALVEDGTGLAFWCTSSEVGVSMDDAGLTPDPWRMQANRRYFSSNYKIFTHMTNGASNDGFTDNLRPGSGGAAPRDLCPPVVLPIQGRHAHHPPVSPTPSKPSAIFMHQCTPHIFINTLTGTGSSAAAAHRRVRHGHRSRRRRCQHWFDAVICCDFHSARSILLSLPAAAGAVSCACHRAGAVVPPRTRPQSGLAPHV